MFSLSVALTHQNPSQVLSSKATNSISLTESSAHISKSADTTWSRLLSTLPTRTKRRCAKSILSISTVEVLMPIKILKELGWRTRAQWSSLTLDGLKLTLTLQVSELTGKDGLLSLTRRSQRSSRLWLRIQRPSSHNCHGQKKWRRTTSLHLISPH